MSSPIPRSWADTVATWAMSSLPSTSRAESSSASLMASTAASMPRFRAAGAAPAATLRRPSLTMACARTVELDLAGDRDAVVRDRGRAPLLVDDDVAALGAERHLDGVGERIDTALERAAGGVVELQGLGHVSRCAFRGWRVEKAERPDGSGRPGRRGGSRVAGRTGDAVLLADLGEDVARGEDEVLLAVVLDLGAAVLAVDDLVADGDVERHAVAVVVDAAGADREDLALLGLLLRGVRDDQAGGRGLLGLHSLDHDAVLERRDVDRHGADLPLREWRG